MAYIPMKKREIIEKTGTTSANGNLNLGKTINDGIVTAVWAENAGSTLCVPILVNGSGWFAHVRGATSANAVVANTEVTVNFIMA